MIYSCSDALRVLYIYIHIVAPSLDGFASCLVCDFVFFPGICVNSNSIALATLKLCICVADGDWQASVYNSILLVSLQGI